MQEILNKKKIDQKLVRLAHQVLEDAAEISQIHVVGISGNGMQIALKIQDELKQNSDKEVFLHEILLNKENPLSTPIVLKSTVEFSNAYIVLVDDVLNSGLTMQYALMKLLEQPVKAVKTVALVDREHRCYPIKCDFVGMTLSTTLQERVEVEFGTEDYFAYLV
ncbi:MAG: phosphoribosyltransferase [Crocinitomicaceae bacterium]|nr:phosphoribosyltransferase [Crocinitomicaceae bacterium]